MSNFNMYFMQNRTTFMERLSERLTAIEAVLKKLEPVEGLLERVALLENTIYTTKKEELYAWLLQNYEPTVDDAMRMATEVSATQPFFNQKRYGKRKKN